jgi:hypothetical protein
MPVTANQPAPYSPGSTIIEVIERHRSRGLPTPITADVLGRAGIAHTLIPRVLQTLQTLDLIDGETGAPTATFEGLRRAPETEYRKRLEEWLKSAYADIFTFVDPSTDDETRVRDAFRNYQPVAQQGRMVSLFLNLCRSAGLAPEKTATPRSAPRPRTRTNPQPSTLGAGRTAMAAHNLRHRPSPAGSATSTGLPAPLAGLLASLPQNGTGWTKERRAQFVATFESVLDFCIPIVAKEPVQNEEAA